MSVRKPTDLNLVVFWVPYIDRTLFVSCKTQEEASTLLWNWITDNYSDTMSIDQMKVACIDSEVLVDSVPRDLVRFSVSDNYIITVDDILHLKVYAFDVDLFLTSLGECSDDGTVLMTFAKNDQAAVHWVRMWLKEFFCGSLNKHLSNSPLIRQCMLIDGASLNNISYMPE